MESSDQLLKNSSTYMWVKLELSILKIGLTTTCTSVLKDRDCHEIFGKMHKIRTTVIIRFLAFTRYTVHFCIISESRDMVKNIQILFFQFCELCKKKFCQSYAWNFASFFRIFPLKTWFHISYLFISSFLC